MTNIFIRRLEHKAHEYFAYLKGMQGKATYLLYFCDDIYGAIALSEFVGMLKEHFKITELKIKIEEPEICIKSLALLSVLQEGGGAR